ncbi:MAG: helix-turn-helix domain-containing protein [Phycisphaerales bacterium]|nr:helix-turn-helix domain-containing protein [Phycisphaerales bacterium]
MVMGRPKGSIEDPERKRLEAVRLEAVRLHQEGRSAKDIAALLGVHPQAVRYWLRQFKRGGIEALRAKFSKSDKRKGKLPGTAKEFERRRLEAVRLHQEGRSIEDIAALLGVLPRTVNEWLQRFSQGGIESLRAKLNKNDRRKGRPGGHSAKELERKRLEAVRLHQEGRSVEDIAALSGVYLSVAGRWLRKFSQGGIESLLAKPPSGRPSMLDYHQKCELRELLLKGAIAFGYPDDRWSCKRVAEVMLRELKVKHNPERLPKLMTILGFAPRRQAEPNGKHFYYWVLERSMSKTTQDITLMSSLPSSQISPDVRSTHLEVREKVIRWLKDKVGMMFFTRDLSKEFPEISGSDTVTFLKPLVRAGILTRHKKKGQKWARYLVVK